MTTIAVIGFGIVAWILISVLLSLFVGRMICLNSPKISPDEPSAVTSVERLPNDRGVEAIAGFPARPIRFVGRAAAIASATAALAPASGRTGVVFHGTTGVGKTTCAVELAYQCRRRFRTVVFWRAPTDSEQSGDALRLLALELEVHLGAKGFTLVDKIATEACLINFRPILAAVFADAGMLLVLDNLEVLLRLDGQWRDHRWAPLVGALTGHCGQSRVILSSRVLPVGLNADDAVLIRPVHALSRDESLRLVGELPTLRALPSSAELTPCLLTLTQGHPQLLEFADAAAAEPPRLAYQMAEIEAAIDGTAPLAAFVTQGHTRLDAEQLLQTVTTWITTIAATVPAPARLLLQVLCRVEEADRNTAVIEANWPALWRCVGEPGEPPSVASTAGLLIEAALIATDSVHYCIPLGVVEAIHATTPALVTVAVDEQLAAWWTAVVSGCTTASQQGVGNTGLRSSLTAARYLLRQHEWNLASCLLERALIQNGYAPATALAVIPLLRRIAEATGALKDRVVLGAALRKVDPDEADTVLRRAYEQAATTSEYKFASTTAGELVTLLRDQGRLYDALAMADQKIEHTNQAGFGIWTKLSDEGRRLQILNLLGRHEQVLVELRTLRAQMADLPDQGSRNDRVNPWNVRECILDIGRLSAAAMACWDDALDLNDEIVSTKQRRGASSSEIAGSRSQDYLPLFHLGRPTEADQLLRDCQDVFATVRDTTRLAVVYGARADLADKCNHSTSAVTFQRTALQLCYLDPKPREIARAHHTLANYLSRAAGNPAEQRAHRLAAVLINSIIGDTREVTRMLEIIASECSDPVAPVSPMTLPEVTRLIDADKRIVFGNLVAALCPDPATALADLLTG